MIARRSLLLFVCCYMILFCVFQNLKNSFQDQGPLCQYRPTDKRSIDFADYESVKFQRRLAEFRNVAFGNTETILTASSFLNANFTECQEPENNKDPKFILQNDAQLRNCLKDCQKFVRDHGYLDFPVTTEEIKFPLAFGIKIHKSPGQAERLLRTIYRPHNVYCIHVDKKSDNETFEIMKRIGECLPNVIVIEDRERVVYASAALVRAELKCMKAVTKSEINWKYYINMAGQEFPFRTNLEMVKVLKELKGANDIETYDHPVYLDWRIQSSFYVTGNSLAENGKKNYLNYKIKISKGSAYGMFTRNFVDFLLNDRVAKDIIQHFNDTFAPEENVWATINTLPWAPGGYPMEVRHMLGTFMSRAVIWAGDSPKCHGNIVRGVCVFKSADFPWLVERPEFFANKFDEAADHNILDCLESWYRHRALRKTVSLDWNFYLNLPHVKLYRRMADFKKSKSYLLTLKRKWMKENKMKDKRT